MLSPVTSFRFLAAFVIVLVSSLYPLHPTPRGFIRTRAVPVRIIRRSGEPTSLFEGVLAETRFSRGRLQSRSPQSCRARQVTDLLSRFADWVIPTAHAQPQICTVKYCSGTNPDCNSYYCDPTRCAAWWFWCDQWGSCGICGEILDGSVGCNWDLECAPCNLYVCFYW